MRALIESNYTGSWEGEKIKAIYKQNTKMYGRTGWKFTAITSTIFN